MGEKFYEKVDDKHPAVDESFSLVCDILGRITSNSNSCILTTDHQFNNVDPFVDTQSCYAGTTRECVTQSANDHP